MSPTPTDSPSTDLSRLETVMAEQEQGSGAPSLRESPALSLDEALALRVRYPRQSAWYLGSLGMALGQADAVIDSAVAAALDRLTLPDESKTNG